MKYYGENDFAKKVSPNRWRFGACPRCKGALYSSHGEDFSCFQCGYVEYTFSTIGGNDGKKEDFIKKGSKQRKERQSINF